MVLEPPGPCFLRLFHECLLTLSGNSECHKTTILMDRNAFRRQGTQRQKKRNTALAALGTWLPATVAPEMCLVAPWACFGVGLGASGLCLERNFDALGTLLAALERSWDAFGCSPAPLGSCLGCLPPLH